MSPAHTKTDSLGYSKVKFTSHFVLARIIYIELTEFGLNLDLLLVCVEKNSSMEDFVGFYEFHYLFPSIGIDTSVRYSIQRRIPIVTTQNPENLEVAQLICE